MIKIPTPKNFSFDACLQFLNRGYAECLYTVNKDSVARLIQITSGLVLIEVSANKKELLVEYSASQTTSIDENEIKSYVIDWFDLDRDISQFYRLLKAHSQTQDFPDIYHGLRLIGIVDLFEALCWCVIGQQINLTFAHKIKTRLVHRYGDSITHTDTQHYCFPTPQILQKAGREELASMQFSKQKINYISNISKAFCTGELNKQALLQLEKTQQMEKLLAIKGIGPWTANYVSMKSLRDMTCIAYGDTGLSSALHTKFDTDKKPDKTAIDNIFLPFAGWESYLNFYLWKSLS